MYMLKNKDIKKYKLDKQDIWSLDELEDCTEYGVYAVQEFLDECIKCYNHYLVFAYNCRYNGASGYSIKEDLIECVYRDYDVSMYLKAISRGNKSITLREYSHDVPMGANTIIIGLTDKEYEKLDKADYEGDFEKIRKFADKHIKEVA